MMWKRPVGDREVVLLEYRCQTCLNHFKTEGLLANKEFKNFEPLMTKDGTIEECIDFFKERADPFVYLKFDVQTEELLDIHKAFNMNSSCFKLINNEEFLIMKKRTDHKFVEFPRES